VHLEIHLADEEGNITDPSGLTIYLQRDTAVEFRLEVFEASDPDSPVDIDDPTDLIEIRSSNNKAAQRLGDWNRVRTGVYENTHFFGGVGRFDIVVLPDIENRSEIPSGSTDTFTMIVEEVPEVSTRPDPIGIVMLVLTLLLVGALVLAATWGKRRNPKGPIPQDSWWNPP